MAYTAGAHTHVMPECLFQSALECLRDGVVLANADGSIEFINPAARAMLAIEPGTRIGPDFSRKVGLFLPDMETLCPAESLPLVRALRGENFQTSIFLRNRLHPEGMWLQVEGAPLAREDGGQAGAVLVYRDVTADPPAGDEQPRVVESLDARLRRLQALFDHALDGMLLADDEMRLVDANPAACRLLGYDRPALLQLTIPEIAAPDVRHNVKSLWESFIRSGEQGGELPLTRRDGSRVEVEFRAVANIVPGVHFSALRDLADRKRIEARLSDAQKSESVGLLAGGAAHDFNNLLVGIIGNATLALKDPQTNEAVSARVREILVAGERAATLTRQLLAYVGKAPPQREIVDLRAAVDDTGALIQSTIPKQVSVEYLLAEAPLIEAAPAQIQQVIMNLVINAAQAIYEQSPGTIRIRTEARRVGDRHRDAQAAALPGGLYAVLEVEDTGRGMDEETRRRIFDPFFTTKVKGKGLGLASIRRIVEDHGGAMSVRSAPGQGSCFTVLFPAGRAPRAAERHEEPADDLTGRGRVLLVDDEVVIQRMTSAALERLGYEVTVLADGRDAVSLLGSAEGDFDIVMIDLGLPGMPARELALEIRRLRPGAKIIASSGYPEAESKRWLQGAEVAGFLQKPYSPEQLGKAMLR